MPKEIRVIIIIGSIEVNMIKPATEKTFAEYSRILFLPYIQSQLSYTKCLDVIWDEYIETFQGPLLEVNTGREPGGAYSLPVKYHVTGSSAYGVKKTSKNFSSFSLNV